MFFTEEGPKTMRWISILIEICMFYYNTNQKCNHYYHWVVIIRANQRNFNRTSLKEKEGPSPSLRCFVIKLEIVLRVKTPSLMFQNKHYFLIYVFLFIKGKYCKK